MIKPISNQINFDNLIFVDSKNKDVKISFHKILIQNQNQNSFIEKNLKTIFENESLSLDEFEKNGETVIPKFEVIETTDDYAFVVYSNRKKFDNYMAKAYTENHEIKDSDKLNFEYYRFCMIDLKRQNMVMINNKNASFWKDSFENLLQKYGLAAAIIPFRNKEVINLIKTQGLKKITVTTASKESIARYIKYSDCSKSDFIEKVSSEFKFKESKSNKNEVFEFIDSSFLKNKEKYSKILVEAQSGIINILEDSITKTVTVPLPKTHERDSEAMQTIKLELLKCLKSISD